MKIAIIAPLHHLEEIRTQDFHLLVAPWFRYKEYKDFYLELRKQKPKDYIIMDNGAWEKGAAVSDERIIKLAKEVKANMIVCPDVFMDGAKTVERTTTFLSSYREKGFSYMVVPQGKSLVEFIDCYKQLLKTDPDMIGLGARVVDTSGQLRRFVAKYLSPEGPPLHLLGLLDLTELQAVYDCKRVLSVDTSYPFKAAVDNIQKLDFERKLNKQELGLARRYIKLIRKFESPITDYFIV